MAGPAAAVAVGAVVSSLLALALLHGSASSSSSSSSSKIGGSSGASMAAPAPDPRTPSLVRLSLGDASGQLTVMWSTRAPTNESCAQLAPAPSPPPPLLPRPRAPLAAAAHRPLLPAAVRVAATWTDGLLQTAQLQPAATADGVARASAGPGTSGTGAQRQLQRWLVQGSGKLAAAPTAAAADAAEAAADPSAGSAAGPVRTLCGGSSPFVEPSTNTTTQFLHQVALAGLLPGQEYLYRVGCEAGGWSSWTRLRAPRGREQFSQQRPATLLLVGDMGFANSQTLPDLVREVEQGQAGGGSGLPVGRIVGGTVGGQSAALGSARRTGQRELELAQQQHQEQLPPLPQQQLEEQQQAAAVAAGLEGEEGSGGGWVAGPAFPDALLHVGDIGYDLQALHGRRASQFLGLIEPLSSRLPYMVLPGNHERNFNFTHYRRLFAMPNRAVGEGLFYSFDIGPLHVLAYNTEVFYWPDCFGTDSMRLQYEWMERDLQAANQNRERTPWILVAGHRPMYCVAARGGTCDWGWSLEHEASRRGIPSNCSLSHPLHCPPSSTGGNQTFPIEELFHKYGVDVAVYGHSHCYERYFPVFNLTAQPPGGSGGGGAAGEGEVVYLNPTATVHVTSGAGGNPEMRRGPDPPPSGPCNDTAPWCAFQSGYAPQGQQSSDYSYSRVASINASHLLWEQYSSTLGRVVDRWWLVNEQHGPFPPLP